VVFYREKFLKTIWDYLNCSFKMDIVGKICAVLEVEKDYVSMNDIWAFVQGRTHCTMFEFVGALQQLFTNGVIIRRIDGGGLEHYKMVKTSLLPEFECELCRVKCNSYTQYETHVHGHQHVTNVHAVRTGSRDRTQWFSCGICHKRLNSSAQIALHMNKCCSKLADLQTPGRLPSCLLPGRGKFNQAKADRCNHDVVDSQDCPCWFDNV